MLLIKCLGDRKPGAIPWSLSCSLCFPGLVIFQRRIPCDFFTPLSDGHNNSPTVTYAALAFLLLNASSIKHLLNIAVGSLLYYAAIPSHASRKLKKTFY